MLWGKLLNLTPQSHMYLCPNLSNGNPHLGLDVNQSVVVQTSRILLHTSYCASTKVFQEGVVPPVLLQILCMPLNGVIHNKHKIQHFTLETIIQHYPLTIYTD